MSEADRNGVVRVHIMPEITSQSQLEILLLGVELDPEPTPDIAHCLNCDWSGNVDECETGRDGDWESGYYEIHLCPCCDDGGCVDDYSMSEKRAEEWNEWRERNKGDQDGTV